jgi:two-component SAPR family response regulator
MDVELPLLAIEAAEEIERIKQNAKTNLKNSKQLSSLIKGDFSWRLDYKVIFRDTYFSTYNKKIEIDLEESQNKYMKDISERLREPDNLNQEELKGLVNFCVNLSDHAQMYRDEIEELMKGEGGCFG